MTQLDALQYKWSKLQVLKMTVSGPTNFNTQRNILGDSPKRCALFEASTIALE